MKSVQQINSFSATDKILLCEQERIVSFSMQSKRRTPDDALYSNMRRIMMRTTTKKGLQHGKYFI